MWIGISRDEASRMKPSNVQYVQNRWPLIELMLSRQDCIAKLREYGIIAPRSACCGCPYLSDKDWRERKGQPEWEATVALSYKLAETGQFMHRALLPMDQVDLDFADPRQMDMFSDMFNNECEGMCSV